MAKKKALIVNDSSMNRSFLKTYLTVNQFEVDGAEDGLVALEKSKKVSTILFSVM